MKSSMFLAIRTTIRNKRVVLLIILISTILLFGTIISTYQKSVNEHIINYSEKNYESLMYTVGKRGNNYKETKKELEDIEHISYISREYDLGTFSLINKEWKNKKMDGTIWINVANNNTIPKVTIGKDFDEEERNYLICPEILYPTGSLNDSKESRLITKKDGVDMIKYLNKTITFEEEVLTSDDKTDFKEVEATIIGLYKVQDYEISENICYSNLPLREETYKKYYENANLESIEYSPSPNAALIILDNYQYHDEVLEKLNRLGYHIEPYAEYDTDLLKALDYNSKIFTIIILLTCLLLICVFLLRNTLNHKEEYITYKYLGYTNLDIIKLILLSNIIIMLLSFAFSVVLSILYKIVLQTIIFYHPFFFSKMEIHLSFKYLLFIFLISIIWSIINGLIHSLFIMKKEL